MRIEAGVQLDQYRLVEKIGEGGMGVVWKARDTTLDRDVAIKVLPEKLARDEEFLARFEREAKAVAALSHPNILTIFDFGEEREVAFAVTELLEGETLGEALTSSGALSVERTLEVALAVADGPRNGVASSPVVAERWGE